MTSFEVAEILERFASQVTRLPGVSRTDPHAFHEAKSELAGDMVRKAKELRTLPRPACALPGRSAIRPGIITVDRRDVRVEVRRRRA